MDRTQINKKAFVIMIIVCEFILQLLCIQNKVNAAEYSFNFTGNTTANVGDTVTLTITANGLTGNVKLSSTNATLSDSQKWVERNTVSITAKITGLPATITATPIELTDNDYNIVSIAPKTITIKEKTPEVKPVEPPSNQGTTNQGGNENQGSNNQGGSTNQGTGNNQGNNSGSENNKGTQIVKPGTTSNPNNSPHNNNQVGQNNNGNNSSNQQNGVKSSNNYLKSLTVNVGTLKPEFYRETYEYTIDNIIESEIEVTAEAEDEKAVVNGTGTIALNEGKNVINIEVNAENDQVRTYTINVNKKENLKESDLRLKTLEIQTINEKNEFKNLNIDFEKEKFNYSLNVEDDITDLSILPTVEKEGIIFEITGDKNLAEGNNEVKITLTKQDDQAVRTVYTLNVNKKAKPIIEVGTKPKLSTNWVLIIMAIVVVVVAIIIGIIMIYNKRKKNKKVNKHSKK